MDFVAVKDNVPFIKLSGCSDVINFDGIGGFGKDYYKTGIPTLVPPKSWSIDCLRKSGLLRIFSYSKLQAGEALSSFELFSIKKNEIKSSK